MKLPTKGIYEHPKMGGWAASTVGGKGCYLDPARTIPTPERACIWHQTTGTTILPPYALGDRLWVRETWQGLSFGDYEPTKSSQCDMRYAATDPLADLDTEARGYPWRPSIFMPRWASRLTLIVTDVRVQRLHEMTSLDARAEGVVRNNVVDTRAPLPLWSVPGTDAGGRHPHDAFAALWDSLNAKRGFGWEANPWVCAVTFEAHQRNIDQMEGA